MIDRQLRNTEKIDASVRAGIRPVTGQLADATGDFACLVFVLSATSARPRVDQSARCPVRELAYPRVVQLPLDLAYPVQFEVESAGVADRLAVDVSSPQSGRGRVTVGTEQTRTLRARAMLHARHARQRHQWRHH